jgi:hypothetical protein
MISLIVAELVSELGLFKSSSELWWLLVLLSPFI